MHSGSSFKLTPRLLDLGFTYLSTVQVAALAQPFLESVVAKLHESSSIGVLDGHDCGVLVARVLANQRIMSINLSGSAPACRAHATSMGKAVLLAYLPSDRLDAYFASADLGNDSPSGTVIIADEAALRKTLAEVQYPRLGVVRSGDRDRRAGGLGADLRSGCIKCRRPSTSAAIRAVCR